MRNAASSKNISCRVPPRQFILLSNGAAAITRRFDALCRLSTNKATLPELVFESVLKVPTVADFLNSAFRVLGQYCVRNRRSVLLNESRHIAEAYRHCLFSLSANYLPFEIVDRRGYRFTF